MEQQNQNIQVEEGFGLIDIIKLLMGKLKILILVALVGAIAGGAFAVWRTVDINYFGTKVEFYVNPERPEESVGETGTAGAGGSQYGVYGAYGRHVMDNMVKLLSSDSFAEELLLNGNPLPEKNSLRNKWFSDTDTRKIDGVEYKMGELLDAAIEEAQAPLSELADAKQKLDAALTERAVAMEEYTDADSVLTTAWRDLYYTFQIPEMSPTFNAEEYRDFTKDYPDLMTDIVEARIACNDAQQEVTRCMMKVNNLEDDWKAKRAVANEVVEVALEYWRESSEYKSNLNFFKESISYSYLDGKESSTDANNLARSFIYVKISICDASADSGYARAGQLLQRVKKVVPAYVETNMTVPDGYSGTNCQRITRTDGIRLTNPHYTTTEAIKYAVVFGVAFAVLTSALLIFLDRADKRLRDTEIITKKFNVPLLGIVPTIDDLKAEQLAKKVEDSVRRKKKKAEAVARKRQEKADVLAQKRMERKNKEAKK